MMEELQPNIFKLHIYNSIKNDNLSQIPFI